MEKRINKPLELYRAPLNYELAGKPFHIILDDGRDLMINFMDGENLQWAKKGEPFRWETYHALKGDEEIYFIHIAPLDDPKHNIVIVLDLAKNLVTWLDTIEGLIPVSDRIVTLKPVFGAIKLPGRHLTEERHHFTKRMVGKRITWHYNQGFAVKHIYYKPHFYRLPVFDRQGTYRDAESCTDPVQKTILQDKADRFRRTEDSYPFCEEPCFHITINSHLNFFAFVEENETYTDPLLAMGGGGLILLQDIERMVEVGLSYSKGDYYLVTAYGVEGFEPDPVESFESPYDETVLKTIPCIYDEDHFSGD